LRIRLGVIGLAGLAATGFGAPAAAAQNPIYLGVGPTVQSISNGDDGLAGLFRFGAKLDEALPGLGVEGEVTRSLSDPQTAGGRDVTFTTFGGYAVYTAPLPDRRVSLRARLGLVWVDADPDGRSSDSETEISWGLGGEYRVTSQLSGYVDYTRMSSSLDHLNLGVQLHF
jgi:hypothetical protein